MSLYDFYISRPRNLFGIIIKRKQSESIFKKAFEDCYLPKDYVLEIGPGDGYIAELCKNNNIKYLGIESNKNISESLSNKNIKIINASVPPLPNNLKDFSYCFILHVIEHFKDVDSAVFLLNSIFKALPMDGRIVIATPDYNFWGNLFYDSDYTHVLPFTRRKLRKLLEDCSYNIIYETIYSGPFLGIKAFGLYIITRLFLPKFLTKFTYSSNNLFVRAVLTFLPNILIIAEKNKNFL